MKRALLDFLPLLLFFGAYRLYDIYAAVMVLMISTALIVVGLKLAGKKPSSVQVWSCLAVLAFGSLTLAIDDPLFIKVKPTFIYLGMAAVLASFQLMGKQPFKAMFGKTSPQVADATWTSLAWQWVFFFAALGGLNLFIAFNFSESFWVSFKTFGFPAITFILVFCQFLVLYRKYSDRDEIEQN